MSAEGQDPESPSVPDAEPTHVHDGHGGDLAVCRYLAGGDGTWRSAVPARSHMCTAVLPPAVLTVSKQRQLCLSADHIQCATYAAASAIVERGGSDPLDADLWPASTSRVLSLEPVRSGLAGSITSPQARTGGQVLLVALIVVAFGVLAITRATAPGSGAGPAPSSGALATPAPVATPAASAGGLTPSPRPSAPVASPQPTPGGSGSPAAARTYKVKRGDTLSSIAAKFGITVRALRKANGLAKGDVIRRGQVLVIPPAEATPAP